MAKVLAKTGLVDEALTRSTGAAGAGGFDGAGALALVVAALSSSCDAATNCSPAGCGETPQAERSETATTAAAARSLVVGMPAPIATAMPTAIPSRKQWLKKSAAG